MKEAIRLTNKTAIALRKSAQKIRTAYFAAAVIVSVLLGAAGIVLGFMWLWAVPLMIAAIAVIDCALMTASRSRYLSLLGQAICTEAAARELRTDRSEQKRRRQAASDLMRVKADMQETMNRQPGAQPFFEEKDDEDEPEDETPMAVAQDHASTDAPRRRRRQSPLTLIRSEQAK
ncbi:MAG: hypothetical protein E7321_04760 [Clostridiales bacterium]|nr:hypothetical protein [Clostridiales bacterium]